MNGDDDDDDDDEGFNLIYLFADKSLIINDLNLCGILIENRNYTIEK